MTLGADLNAQQVSLQDGYVAYYSKIPKFISL